MRILVFFIIFWIGISTNCFAQSNNNSKISLITCGPGDDLYALFGHTALRLYDPDRNLDIVFNYGIFDSSDPFFIVNFFRGHMRYILGAQRYGDFLEGYVQDKRWVIEQDLNLTAQERQSIETFLRHNARPENREYDYNYFYDNCSTRVKELLEKLLPNYTYVDSPIKTTTYRKLLNEYLVGRDWTDFGIDIIIGSPGDEVIDHNGQMFLPDYVSLYMMRFKNSEGVALAAEPYDVLTIGTNPPKSWLITPFVLFAVLMLIELIVFIKRDWWSNKWLRIYDIGWFVLTSLSTALILFMLTTLHTACHSNYNLLWISPLFIPFTILFFMKKNKWLKWNGVAIIIMFIITILGARFWPQVFPSVGLLIIGILTLKVVRVMGHRFQPRINAN